MSYEPAPNHHTQSSSGGSGLAITALVLGVLALLSSWTVVGGILLGLGAIILGFVALSKIKKGQAGGKAMAIIGIVLGALGVIVAIGLIALGASLLNSESGQNLQDCLREAGNDEAAQQQCQREFEDELSG